MHIPCSSTIWSHSEVRQAVRRLAKEVLGAPAFNVNNASSDLLLLKRELHHAADGCHVLFKVFDEV